MQKTVSLIVILASNYELWAVPVKMYLGETFASGKLLSFVQGL